MGKACLKKCLLSLLSLLICLAVAELILRMTFKGPLTTDSLVVNDPELAFTLRKGVDCWGISREFCVRYATDRELGLRTPTPECNLPAAPDLVVYGDSFVFGHGVNYGQVFTTLLAEELGGCTVVNAGIFNYGPDQSYLLAQRLRSRFDDPTELLVIYSGNDFDDINRFGIVRPGEQGPRFHAATDPGSKTRRVLTGLPFYRVLCRFRLWHLFRLSVLQRRGRTENLDITSPDESPEGQPVDKRLAIVLQAWSEQIGDDFLVAVVHDRTRSMVSSPEMAYLRQRLSASGIRWREFAGPDLSDDAFAQLYFHEDGHWNPSGHQWIASQMLPWLRSNELNLEKCKKPHFQQ